MPRLTETDGLTDLQRDILGAVREFVEPRSSRWPVNSTVPTPTRTRSWPGCGNWECSG